MIRLFVGLELSSELKEALVIARSGVEGARWQSDAQVHLTLAFIGEVPTGSMRQIEDALSAIEFAPFDLALEHLDMFGTSYQPKTLWTGVAEEAPLHHLHEKILTALERIDVETDRRRYKPHVTLARFPRGIHTQIEDWVTTNGIVKTPIQRVGYFSLFSSQRSSAGPSYLVESRFGEGAPQDADFEMVERLEMETL